jgi:class 3 adenylate cyclase
VPAPHVTRSKPPATTDQEREPLSYTPQRLADKILTSRSALEGERKQVTALFADVTGFSTLSEQLDAEAVHSLMDGCFDILTRHVHHYEGTVNQFTGDGIMALFGAPITHEDHAVRALQDVLQRAAVIGRVFTHAMLRHVVDNVTALEQQLVQLEELAFIYPTRLAPERE